MHILGGFMVGLFIQTAMDHIDHAKVNKRRFFIAVLSALAVGIVWEITEVYFGLTAGLSPTSRLDTIKDIIDDIIGGALSVWFWGSLFNNTKIHDKQSTESR